MNFKEKFLQLTARTCPHGYESIFESYLPKGYNTDVHGNHFIVVGNNPTTMFTCHLDTACDKLEKVKHRFIHNGEFIATDGTTILGADDKAGMVIMLHMIENKIPGLYYFFLGEEVGCVGSKKASKDLYLKGDTNIKKVVSFDRRGYDSVITHQFYGRCCSDEFATELAKQLSGPTSKEGISLNFSPDNTGICTDSIQYQDFIPECTNISVGYFNEHTGSEVQNILFLEYLGEAVLKVKWEELPIVRDPQKEWENWKNSYKNTNKQKSTYNTSYDSDFHASDDDFEIDEEITFDNNFFLYAKNDDNIMTKFLVSKERIQHEIELIGRVLIDWGYEPEYDKIDWNGNSWKYSFNGEEASEVLTRRDLANINTEFAKIQKRHLRETDEQLVS